MIEVFAAGYAAGNREERRAACGIIVVAGDGQELVRRRFTFPLGNATRNLAELKAAWIGLLCLKDRPTTVTLHTNSHYVADMLAKTEAGAYLRANPQANPNDVARLRQVAQETGTVAVAVSRFDDGLGGEALAMAKTALEQPPTDSGSTWGDGDDNGTAGEAGQGGA